jgi:hypothetical protein
MHLADFAVTHQHTRQPEVVIRPLLAADLKDAVVAAHGAHQCLALVYKQRQRLLAVHVFARFARHDADECVPVVRRRDDYRVDVLAV